MHVEYIVWVVTSSISSPNPMEKVVIDNNYDESVLGTEEPGQRKPGATFKEKLSKGANFRKCLQ